VTELVRVQEQVRYVFLRWRIGEMVGALRKLAYSRPSHRSKHQYLMVEGSVGGKRISPAAALHGVPLLENFEAVEHPDEPTEMDDPVRCPPPEKSIVQDGLIWRERVSRHFHHRPIDRVRTWQEGDAVRLAGGVVSNPGRPNHSNFSERSLFVTHSAPETAVSQMLL